MITIDERVQQLLAQLPDEPSDEFVEQAVRVWASIATAKEAA